MKILRWTWLAAAALALSFARASAWQPANHIELSCHRTANQDVPENTLDSLEQAALLGCDIVEVDIRRTLDGRLVLQHDGDLERLTDGAGEVENRYYDDLRLLDAGGWMNDRFTGLRIPLFEEALRRAKQLNIHLYLDFKDKGMGADVLAALQHEGMLDRVQVGGESDDFTRLHPLTPEGKTVWLSWNVTADEVNGHHAQHEKVMANFSESEHAMDLQAMQAAVAAGVDGINVDYPRLGADAVGRPVERRLADLAAQASAGEAQARAHAILELSRYRGFPLQAWFVHWLLDSNGQVSRAAAIALVQVRPRTLPGIFASALKSEHAAVRANAAWAIGALHGPAKTLLPLLSDTDSAVQQEALVALAHIPDPVSAQPLLSLLSSSDAAVRGDAALALAKHQPQLASTAVPGQLRRELSAVLALYNAYIKRGSTPLSEAEKATIVEYYRCQSKEVLAISMLKSPDATKVLEEFAFRPGRDFAVVDGLISAFNLWDRIGEDPAPAIQALDAKDPAVADRAEWMLIKSDAQNEMKTIAAIRSAIQSPQLSQRRRAIRIAGWRGDAALMPLLQSMLHSDPADADLIAWAIAKIQLLHPPTLESFDGLRN